MTSNRVIARNVTTEGMRLLEAVKAAGVNGITRRELENIIGKKLNRWSLAQVDLLELQGCITIAIRPVEGRLVFEYLYRVIED